MRQHMALALGVFAMLAGAITAVPAAAGAATVTHFRCQTVFGLGNGSAPGTVLYTSVNAPSETGPCDSPGGLYFETPGYQGSGSPVDVVLTITGHSATLRVTGKVYGSFGSADAVAVWTSKTSHIEVNRRTVNDGSECKIEDVERDWQPAPSALTLTFANGTKYTYDFPQGTIGESVSSNTVCK